MSGIGPSGLPRKSMERAITLTGMDNLQGQIQVLQISIRRQRFAIVALAGILAGSSLIGAARPAGDAAFDTITCNAIVTRSWKVVDHQDRIRIEAGERSKHEVAIYWLDRAGLTRIASGTEADGRAYTGWFDMKRAQRVSVGISNDGNGDVRWADVSGKVRMAAGTKMDGTAFFIPPAGE